MRVDRDKLIRRLRPEKREHAKTTALDWIKSPWVILLWPILSFVLLDAATVVNNAKTLNSEWENIKPSIYETESWSGVWVTTPEGYVDGEDMGIDWDAPNEPHLEIIAEEDGFGGTISTHGICKMVGWDFLQLEGKLPIVGNSTTAIVWDIIQGHRQEFARLKLTRTGISMEVELLEGSPAMFPTKAKVWIAPDEVPLQINPSERPYCAEK